MIKSVVLFLVAVALVCAGLFSYSGKHAGDAILELEPEISQNEARQEEAYKNRRMDIGTFIGVNISELSPVQEVLGGTFYVTETNLANGKGYVKYEDGHMQYIADVTYIEDERNGYAITKFKVRDPDAR